MPDVNRYRYGDVNPVIVTIALNQEASVGDLVAQIGGTLVRAQDVAWDTNLATTQTAFSTGFVGVSAQRKKAGDAMPGHGTGQVLNIRVDSTGTFEFECAAGAFNSALVGDLVGPAKATGNALLTQTVAPVASAALAIGRVAEKPAQGATRVLIRVFSKVLAPL